MTVVAEGYMESHLVIDRMDPRYTASGSVLNDKINDTCMSSETFDMTFQAVFDIPEGGVGQQMSVEVILKNEADCASPSWTWFVGSDCNVDTYLECSRNTISSSNNHMSRCGVTCACPFRCDYLYLKYNRKLFGKDDNNEICEVRLMFGDFEPNLQL